MKALKVCYMDRTCKQGKHGILERSRNFLQRLTYIQIIRSMARKITIWLYFDSSIQFILCI